MRKLITLMAFATVAGALVFGAAASLDVNSQNLGSGTEVVASCDTDGVSVSYDLDGADPTQVTGVTLTGVAAACDTQALYVVVYDASSASLASQNGTVDESTADGAEALTFTSAVAAEDIEGIAVTITG